MVEDVDASDALREQRKNDRYWTSLDEGAVERLVENADEFLKAQLDISLNSDQRSMQVASIMATAAAAAVGFAAGAANGNLSFWMLLSGGILFLASAGCAARASWPMEVHFPAINPHHLLKKSLLVKKRLGVLVREYHLKQQMIEENRPRLATALNWYERAIILGAIGAVISVAGIGAKAFYPATEVSVNRSGYLFGPLPVGGVLPERDVPLGAAGRGATR